VVRPAAVGPGRPDRPDRGHHAGPSCTAACPRPSRPRPRGPRTAAC
jgi:hypothetical protein